MAMALHHAVALSCNCISHRWDIIWSDPKTRAGGESSPLSGSWLILMHWFKCRKPWNTCKLNPATCYVGISTLRFQAFISKLCSFGDSKHLAPLTQSCLNCCSPTSVWATVSVTAIHDSQHAEFPSKPHLLGTHISQHPGTQTRWS